MCKQNYYCSSLLQVTSSKMAAIASGDWRVQRKMFMQTLCHRLGYLGTKDLPHGCKHFWIWETPKRVHVQGKVAHSETGKSNFMPRFQTTRGRMVPRLPFPSLSFFLIICPETAFSITLLLSTHTSDTVYSGWRSHNPRLMVVKGTFLMRDKHTRETTVGLFSRWQSSFDSALCFDCMSLTVRPTSQKPEEIWYWEKIAVGYGDPGTEWQGVAKQRQKRQASNCRNDLRKPLTPQM